MFSRQGIQGSHKVEGTQCPAGHCEPIQVGQRVHREESKELEPGDRMRVQVSEKGAGESGEKYRLLVDLE